MRARFVSIYPGYAYCVGTTGNIEMQNSIPGLAAGMAVTSLNALLLL